ncbi:MAG: membrane integrity-associated transporter subunit PqiC [Desulfurivibrionaceae bacterium]
MKRFLKEFSFSPAAVILALLCGGCLGGGHPVEHYYLGAAVSESGAPLPKELKLSSGEFIAVGPVKLTPELKRAGIAVRTGDYRLRVSQTRVWAAPLEEMMAFSLARNLSILLDTDRVEVYPDPRYGEVRYQVELEVVEFSGGLKKGFDCEIIWTLSDDRKGGILTRKRFSRREPLEEEDYDAYVAAASRSLAALARDISTALPAAESR